MKRKIAVVGLGYVGLPVAVAFGKQQEVVGFDINETRINELKNGYDCTNELNDEDLKKSNIKFTNQPEELNKVDFIIVAVPTPINKNNQPDLTPLIKASETVGKALAKDTIVVYESTVYPGATEEDCVPVLEKFSGLTNGSDFFVGYSPERINPGDKVHTFETITKVVSAQTPKVLEVVAEVYSMVVKEGVHKASSIKVAEAAKVIENTQRDVNIALMNELSIIFEKINISTLEVLKAANTKWNFINFQPGLVGGHCIGVDPYYLTYKAQELGHHPEVILAGRRINDNMPKVAVENLVRNIIKHNYNFSDLKIRIYGLTFKENVTDLRNSKVIELIKHLESYNIKYEVTDPFANPIEAANKYDISLINEKELDCSEVAIVAVGHNIYKENTNIILDKFSKKEGIILDIAGIIDGNNLPEDIKLITL